MKKKVVAKKKEKKKLKLDLILELLGYCPEDVKEDSPLVRLGSKGKDGYEDNAIVGVTIGEEDGPRLIYDYNKLAEELAADARKSDKDSTDEELFEQAREYIDFNVLRSLPYEENAPIVGEFLSVEDLKQVKNSDIKKSK